MQESVEAGDSESKGRAKGAEAQRRSEFILRRACWYGRVTGRDIREAFDVSRQIAARDMKQSVSRWTWVDAGGGVHPILASGTRAVIPINPVHFHEEASPARMLQLLSAKADFSLTGLRPEEVSVLFPVDRAQNIDPDILAVMLQAVLDKSAQGLSSRAVVVRYVGLKIGDVYRERRILPVALEFDGAQTRVHAHDLEPEAGKAGYPIKAFVLTRMEQARFSDEGLPKNFVRRGVSQRKTARFRLTFDPRLTEDQKSALRRELGIHDGALLIPENQAHSFRRFYTNGMPPDTSPDIIWPPVIFTEKLD